ncbi:MAG: hydroxyacid dehydrogenase [Anaerolineae bacterium]|nr:hydroxyacid dehydrogenase [Anaerolineae bacterium]
MATIWIERGLYPEAVALATGHEIRSPAPEIGQPGSDLSGVHAIIISNLPPIDAEFLSRAPDLWVVARPGIGIDNVVVEDCTAAKVLVVHTPEAPTESTAEHAVTLIFATARRLKIADQGLRSEGWATDRTPMRGIELRGKTLGLVGLGRIGGRVAHIMGAGVGMRVIAFDPYTTPERAAAIGVELQPSLADVMRQADIVSVHCPLMPSTRGLVSREMLGLLKPGAILVNAARGPIVDEAALIDALRSGHLAGAGLDVFDPEPALPGNPLFDMPQVIVTPHIASFTPDAVHMMSMGIMEEVVTVLSGQRPRWLCNPEAWPGRVKTV